MPNEFITPKQFTDGLIECARRQAWRMPLADAEHIAGTRVCGIGIRSAIVTSLIMTCRERVESQPGVPSGAD